MAISKAANNAHLLFSKRILTKRKTRKTFKIPKKAGVTLTPHSVNPKINIEGILAYINKGARHSANEWI